NLKLTAPEELNHNQTAEHISMGHDRNVGIGTRYATHKLTVNGSVMATKVKIVAPDMMPDYVFNKNYNLKSLEEVEKFTKKYKHLPNIPSEKEIRTKNELDISEFQMKLLEKIEENMLYILQLNKKNKKFESENNKLKRKLADIEKDNLILKSRQDILEKTVENQVKAKNKRWHQFWK
ncbi:MAG: hypothetical protein GY730_11495, partial [bacterium]|nr:hypothetical protein [bacterium]